MHPTERLIRWLVILGALVASAALWWPLPAHAARIKEVASVQGVRSNALVGYGLVMALDGTGDSSTGVPFLPQSMIALLQQNGVTVPHGTNLQLKNVAAVMVTAQLPPFARPGQTIDVTVSSMGNAKSLRGGTLISTPLRGADGQIYAMAQGNLLVGGAGAAAGGSKVQVKSLNAGRIPEGATVERSVPTPLVAGDTLQLDLNANDFADQGATTGIGNDSPRVTITTGGGDAAAGTTVVRLGSNNGDNETFAQREGSDVVFVISRTAGESVNPALAAFQAPLPTDGGTAADASAAPPAPPPGMPGMGGAPGNMQLPPGVLEQLQRHRVTIFGALPVMLNALLHVPNASSFDISGLRACFAGGDAVATELQRRFKETFRVDVTEACGMTEVQPYACNPLGARGKVGSIGLPAPGATLRLVDEFGRDVADGEAGEVLVKSPAAMVGYWKDPDATAATIRDGWLSTGDLARKDADGYYWFVGRKKEIIVRGGSNISPLEVEDAIYQYPAVREVGVVGCPSSDLGEVVLAFVGLKNGDSATEQDIKDFLAARMAAYKIPERIIFVPELPKGLTGKVHRRTLKEWAAQG